MPPPQYLGVGTTYVDTMPTALTLPYSFAIGSTHLPAGLTTGDRLFLWVFYAHFGTGTADISEPTGWTRDFDGQTTTSTSGGVLWHGVPFTGRYGIDGCTLPAVFNITGTATDIHWKPSAVCAAWSPSYAVSTFRVVQASSRFGASGPSTTLVPENTGTPPPGWDQVSASFDIGIPTDGTIATFVWTRDNAVMSGFGNNPSGFTHRANIGDLFSHAGLTANMMIADYRSLTTAFATPPAYNKSGTGATRGIAYLMQTPDPGLPSGRGGLIAGAAGL